MDEAALFAALQEQRRVWVELDASRAVSICMLRPSETDMPAYMGGVKVAHIIEQAIDWKGVTEAVLLGEGVGGPTAVPFSRLVWSEVVSDRTSWAVKAIKGLAASIVSHKQSTDDLRGNSRASSTSSPASRTKGTSRRSARKRTR